ncbi:hypothetical protein AB6E88_01745 [Providencia hangzhouensis]
MELFVFKVVITPLLLLTASLAARRWGESIGGLIVGLPLTSGPSLFSLLSNMAQNLPRSNFRLIISNGCAGLFCGRVLFFSCIWLLQSSHYSDTHI